MIETELYEPMLEELKYVCRLSPLSALITSRALLESILNEVILKKEFLTDTEKIEKETLGKKIELLDKRKFLKERELTSIRTILFKGNDAAHKLKAEISTAESVYSELLDFYKYIINLKIQENSNIEEVKNGDEQKKYRGFVDEYDGKRIGFIKNKDNEERYIFSITSSETISADHIKIGDEIQFELEENLNKNKAEYKAYNLEHIAKVVLIGRTPTNGRYAFLKCGNREEDIYLNIYNVDTHIKKGQDLLIKIKTGTNKDEAFDIKMA